MRNPQQQIELISQQEIDRLQSLLEDIQNGDINRRGIEGRLQDSIRMINRLNEINGQQGE